jgi:hypothetical protein
MSLSHLTPATNRRRFLIGAALAPAAATIPGEAGAAPHLPLPQGEAALTPNAREFLAAMSAVEAHYVGASFESREEVEAHEAEGDRLTDIADEISGRILDKQAETWPELVAQALVARAWAADDPDKHWAAFDHGGSDAAPFETCLSVLVMAGLTDGEIERNGDGRPTPVYEVENEPRPGCNSGPVSEFIAAFGGEKAIADFTGASPTWVQIWRERGISKGFELRLFLEAVRRGIPVDPAALDAPAELHSVMTRLQRSAFEWS